MYNVVWLFIGGGFKFKNDTLGQKSLCATLCSGALPLAAETNMVKERKGFVRYAI